MHRCFGTVEYRAHGTRMHAERFGDVALSEPTRKQSMDTAVMRTAQNSGVIVLMAYHVERAFT